MNANVLDEIQLHVGDFNWTVSPISLSTYPLYPGLSTMWMVQILGYQNYLFWSPRKCGFTSFYNLYTLISTHCDAANGEANLWIGRWQIYANWNNVKCHCCEIMLSHFSMRLLIFQNMDSGQFSTKKFLNNSIILQSSFDKFISMIISQLRHCDCGICEGPNWGNFLKFICCV